MNVRILLLAASTPLLGQEYILPVLPGNRSSSPNARAIIGLSLAATERSWKERAHYTYMERAEDRRLDSNGNVKSEQVEVSDITFVNGAPVPQLVEHNGMPPSPEEQKKYQEKVRKLKQETLKDRTARLLVEEEDTVSLIREVPLAFDFSMIGDDKIDGRPAYVLQATPHPGYVPRGKYGKMFSRLEGKLWIDQQELGWVKADAQVIEPMSMGLFLARVLPGSRVTMEQTRVGEGIWMPKHIEARANAKIFLIKALVVDRRLTYTDYRPAQTYFPPPHENHE